MTETDHSDKDGPRDEVLAAEYALGVLSFADRKRLEARIEREPAFALLVARWEDRLSPLEDAGEEAPPRAVYQRIEKRLFAAPASNAVGRAGWWHSVALWRGVSFASVALLIASVALQSGLFAPPAPPAPLVASMTGENSPLALLARYEAGSGRIEVTPVAANAGPPHSLELWVVPGGDKPPVSLGVLPQDGRGVITVPATLRAQLGEGMTLAVTLEPPGGSPNGAPTGAVIAAGQARYR
jgi:anti-sigma-K factor RskA